MMKSILKHPYLIGFKKENIQECLSKIKTSLMPSYKVETNGIPLLDENEIMWTLVNMSEQNDFEIKLQHRSTFQSSIAIERCNGELNYNIKSASGGGLEAVMLIHEIINLKL